jgi:hypothetical protein
MRSDMAKVLVERPRVPGWKATNVRKGYRKSLNKALDSGESPPIREGIKHRSGGTKSFNEHLGPLRRFLDRNVGRPWNKVYSEICQHVDRGNVVQKHILTHLFQYVVTNVVLIDGEPHDGTPGYWYGRPLRAVSHSHQWYVCPRSGLLRRSRQVPRRRPGRPAPPRRVRLSKTEMCLELNGRWELVTLAPLPLPVGPANKFDVVLGRNVPAQDGLAEAQRTYGAAVYAVSRRLLAKRELKELPIPRDWLR